MSAQRSQLRIAAPTTRPPLSDTHTHTHTLFSHSASYTVWTALLWW